MGQDARIPWVALLHVRSLDGPNDELGGNIGAYATVLALASTESEYRETVASEMQALGLFVAELDDLRPYSPDDEDPENIKLCASRLSAEWPVQYGDFYAYSRDESH